MADVTPQAIILRPGEGRAIDLGGFAMTVKATSDDTLGAFSILEADEPPGFGPPMHIHHNAAEAFYVLQGEYIMFIGTDEIACPAGSFIFIPAGVTHGFPGRSSTEPQAQPLLAGRHGGLLRRPERRDRQWRDRP